jgi:hypothetical protein
MNDKVKNLCRLISSPELVKGVWAMVKSQYPAFPKDACGAVLSTFLKQAGFHHTFGLWAQAEAEEMTLNGWEKIDPKTPIKSGDVFVCADYNKNGATDHVGVVYSMSADPDEFWAIDNRTDHCVGGKPYLRNIGKGIYTPVDYFLRYTGE